MLVTLLALLAAPADPTGVWKTPRGATIRVERCGAALCGRIASLPSFAGNPRGLDLNNKDKAKRGQALVGLAMLTGFAGGPRQWTGGSVYNPEDGRTYSGRIELVDAGTLKLTGCALRIFCRSQVWKRVG
jgi:uncharacterized protein (DUF2147 family)